MAVVTVNGTTVDIGTDRLNLIQAAARGGVVIPSYCWHPALSVVASCRMCLVEVGDKKPDGSVAMQPKVVPGCQTPAKDGTIIITNSPKAKHAQEQTLESLLLNHPLDCPVCDKAGECRLQDYSYGFGRSTSRMVDEKNLPPNKDYIGEHITLFTDRCIMCSRCVRFTREFSGTAELQVVSRGHHSEIDIFPGEPLNNKLSGNVVDLCPVGASAAKISFISSASGFSRNRNRYAPTAVPAAALPSIPTRTLSIACARATIRRHKAISCAMRDGSTIPTSIHGSVCAARFIAMPARSPPRHGKS